MKSMSILILGAGIMQIPSLKAAKARGWFVAVADGNPEAPGIALADHYLPVDLKDHEGMVKAARVLQEKYGLDGVFTAGTDFSVTVAKVAQALKLPGIPVESALGASDKGIMREVLFRGGVRIPAYVVLEGNEVRPARALTFPLVVKPVDNMGARGVCRVDTCDRLEEAVQEALVHSRSKRVLVEEYLEGPEFSIDALVEDQTIYLCGVADRHIFFPPYFVEMGHTIPTIASPEVLEAIEQEFSKAVRALGITHGAAKGDVKISGQKVWIGEIAARLSGGFMSGWTFPYASGVDVTGAALNLAVGLPKGPTEPLLDHTCAERGILSIPGTVEKIEGVQKVRSYPLVRDLFILIKVGDHVRFPQNNVEKCANVIAASANREAAVQAAEVSRRELVLRLQGGDVKTAAFLFGDKPLWIPPAFQLMVPQNIDSYEAMPFLTIPKPQSRIGAIMVETLPLLSLEESVDWHGQSMENALGAIQNLAGVSFEANQPKSKGRKESVLVLGKLFWHAFLRGGVQGGLWVIDTLEGLLKGNKIVCEEDVLREFNL